MTDLELFKVYLGAGADGYPLEWHRCAVRDFDAKPVFYGIKDIVREEAGNRCIRCGHPYEKGMGEWSPCDDRCTHGGPLRVYGSDNGREAAWIECSAEGVQGTAAQILAEGFRVEAQWRVLTVHHLNGIKLDCRWWNLVSLCQRDHLIIQGKVRLEREFIREHSPWFKPYAAGWYASHYLNEHLTREQTMERLDELLQLELAQESLF